MTRLVRVLLALMATLAIAVTAGCSLDPTRLPVPGAYTPHHTYRIKIQFSSVLNLPARAKVDSGGVQIGVLDHVQLEGTTAVAYVEMSGETKFPNDTRAELRQATPLGDIYIALLPPADRSGNKAVLRDGDTIPLRNTAPADNVEDVLRSVSNLVAGGAIGTLQDTVVNVNKAFPKDPAELNRIQKTIGGVLNDLAANQDTIDGILSSLENISTNLAANTEVFNRLPRGRRSSKGSRRSPWPSSKSSGTLKTSATSADNSSIPSSETLCKCCPTSRRWWARWQPLTPPFRCWPTS
jgi:phospholipid/cholesterol/gamma-HCH transport system substrate-binding protein